MLFSKKNEECSYYSEGGSFGVVLKGKSIELLGEVEHNFENCFIVNNFDMEIEAVGDILKNKNCVQFVNRLLTAPLTRSNYEMLGVRHIQLPKATSFLDFKMREVMKVYSDYGMTLHYLPKSLLEFNKNFGKEYAKKCPNTGAMAIYYALKMLRPKVLWVIGLDFYQHDYLFRRTHQNPLELQREKMDRINLVQVMADLFKSNPDTQIKMVTYCDDFPELENVEIINPSTV